MEAFFSWLFADPYGLGVNIFFAVTIILMIRDSQKPPLLTSIPTGIALIILGVGGSYAASAPAIASALNGGLWIYLGFQRWKQENAEKSAPTQSASLS